MARLPNLRGSDEAPMMATVLAVCVIWKDLTRIQNTTRIECRLDTLHQRNRIRGEFQRQVRRFRETDSMFPADRSFQRDHAFEELPLRRLRAFLSPEP